MRKRDTLYREIHRQIPSLYPELPLKRLRSSRTRREQCARARARSLSQLAWAVNVLRFDDRPGTIPVCRFCFFCFFCCSFFFLFFFFCCCWCCWWYQGVVGYRDDFCGSVLLAYVSICVFICICIRVSEYVPRNFRIRISKEFIENVNSYCYCFIYYFFFFLLL